MNLSHCHPDFGGIISFLDFEEIGVFAHEVCDGSTRAKDGRQIFYLGACTQGKCMPFIL